MVGQKIRESIFLKMFLTVIVTTLLLKVIFFVSLKFIMRPHIENNVKKVFVGYANLLFEDVGNNFDSTKIQEIADKSQMIIVYKNSATGKEWSTNPEMTYFPREFNRFYVLYDDEYFGFRIGRVHARVYRDDGEYLLVTNMKNAVIQLAWIQILTPFLGIIIVAFLTYWLLRSILKPIKAFMIGADKFGAGKFDYRISIKRNDEFGKLANSFNSMGEKLSRLVEQKEQLIRDISHEMKTPITRATMALEFMEQSEMKDRISSDLKDLNRMITEILETERLRSSYGGLSIEPVDFEELVDGITAKYAIKGLVQIDHQTKIIPGMERVPLDKERMRMVISNILGNALKYCDKESGSVEIETTIDRKKLQFIVKDSGIGINESELENIFEPFYRVDKARSRGTGGYGLGLHLCKKIVEAHGGTIFISSHPGEGTTVVINIPVEISNKEI